jgi:hypothetical protein
MEGKQIHQQRQHNEMIGAAKNFRLCMQFQLTQKNSK